MNRIVLTGNITKDLELKQTTSGKSVINFDIGVKRPMQKDTTDFFTIVAWNQTAEYLSKYAKKGSRVAVEGKLTTRKWEDQNGNKRIAYEIVADSVELFDSKPADSVTLADVRKEEQQWEEIPSDEALPF